MVMRQRCEIFCARALVKFDEMMRIPVLGLPLVNHVLETHFGRMPVMLALKFIVNAAELIHFLRIPVAHFRLALRPPVRPDAELRVAEPVRHLIAAGERFPGRLKRPGGDAKSRRRDNRRRCGRINNGGRSDRFSDRCRASRQRIRVNRIGVGGERWQHRQRRGGPGEQRGFFDEAAAGELVFHRMNFNLAMVSRKCEPKNYELWRDVVLTDDSQLV